MGGLRAPSVVCPENTVHYTPHLGYPIILQASTTENTRHYTPHLGYPTHSRASKRCRTLWIQTSMPLKHTGPASGDPPSRNGRGRFFFPPRPKRLNAPRRRAHLGHPLPAPYIPPLSPPGSQAYLRPSPPPFPQALDPQNPHVPQLPLAWPPRPGRPPHRTSLPTEPRCHCLAAHCLAPH